MENKFQSPKVGSAIKIVKSPENYYFTALIKQADLHNCYITKSKNENENKEYFNLSLKIIKSPKNEATHIVTDSLYYSKGIKDQFAEVNLNLRKEKLLNAKPDKDGNVGITISLFNKEIEREFQIGDFKIHLTKPAGESILKEDYIGNGILLHNQKDKQNTTRINRDFCGSGFINYNEKLPGGSALNISVNQPQVIEAAKGKQNVFVNLIHYQNIADKFAAYISNTKDDKSALYTFKIDVKEFEKLPVNEQNYTKIAGYFDDTIENKNYNIALVQYMTMEQKKNAQPIKVGIGADRKHIDRWQNENNENKNSFDKNIKDKQKENKDNKIPSAKNIKDKGEGKKNQKGLQNN